MKKFLYIFIVLLLILAHIPALAYTSKSFDTNAPSSFNDISGHWAEESINKAVAMGLILGHPDGSFDPDSPITLAELLAMLVPTVTGEKPEITDGENWYEPYAEVAFKTGILNHFTHQELNDFYNSPSIRLVSNVLFYNTLSALELTSQPEINTDNVSKAQLGLKTFKDSGDIFNDLYIISTYSCVAHDLVKGTDLRTLEPYSYITRAEAVAMLLRLKSYQLQRANGMSYIDPFLYHDYYFTCIQKDKGVTYPIANSGRPIITDDGTVYLTLSGIVSLLEAYESEYNIQKTIDSDIYNGFYKYYISVPENKHYSYALGDGSIYGQSSVYSGSIKNSKGKEYVFTCPTPTGDKLVVKNIPMLPVEDVLKFFEIPYDTILHSFGKTSIVVSF